jgi:hypothetical protein
MSESPSFHRGLSTTEFWEECRKRRWMVSSAEIYEAIGGPSKIPKKQSRRVYREGKDSVLRYCRSLEEVFPEDASWHMRTVLSDLSDMAHVDYYSVE